MAPPRTLNDQQLAYVRRHASTRSARIIALELGLTENQVEGAGRRNGISFCSQGRGGKRVHWSAWKDQIAACIAEGLTMTETGERLGLTRCSVGGYAKRAGLSFGKSPEDIRRARVAAANRKRALSTPEELAAKAERRKASKDAYRARKHAARLEGMYLPNPTPRLSVRLPVAPTLAQEYDRGRAPGLQLVELRWNSCRWPIGEPKAEGFYFCAADTGGDKRYCAHHRHRAIRSAA